MPVFIEPTEQFNRCIAKLTDSEAARVWREMEHLNNRLGSLLGSADKLNDSVENVAERTAIDLVCKHHKIARELLFSPSTNRKISEARRNLIALLHKELHYVHGDIGLLLRRHRTTICDALRVHDNLSRTEKQYLAHYQLLVQEFRMECAKLTF